MPERSEWKSVKYMRQGEELVYDYSLWLPCPLADWDVWDYWERDTVESIREHLGPGDVLFEIGSETGWMSCVLSQIVGPRALVLIEPSDVFWPNIRQTWEANNDEEPLFAWRGLIGSEPSREPLRAGWPSESEGELTKDRAYTYLFNAGDCPATTIDDFVARTGIVPKGLQIDVEGAELEALKGAEGVLREHRPLVWLSVHPDLMEKDFDTDSAALRPWLARLGYGMELLATDHEEHWFCCPSDTSRSVPL